VDEKQFYKRLLLAGQVARESAASYVVEQLPEELCFTLSAYNDPRGRPGPPGTIKFLGGRLLKPNDLHRLSASRAAALLWVDGKVPAWVNIGVAACRGMKTELLIHFSRRLVLADEGQLPPDFGCAKGNRLVPFRIRGPALPGGWRSVELDGRVPLVPDRGLTSEDAT
jgi:hypothetical protein